LVETYTLAESTTRTDEETSTDGTTDGNHVKMARLHGAVELNQAVTVVLLLEGVQVDSHPGPLVFVIEGGVDVTSKSTCLDIGARDRLDLDSLLAAIDGNGVLGRHVG
jgi:hypothetical protein